MSNAELRIEDRINNGGIYVFDSGAFWVGLTAATLLGIAFAGGAIALFKQEHKLSALLVGCALLSLGGIAAALHIFRFRDRIVEVTDEGIFVRDRHGKQIEGIHWVELGRVTERRKMAQIVLWDKLGARRVRVDQQYRNFKHIRSTILDEYSQRFTPPPLPFEFQGSPLWYDTFLYATFAVGAGWISQVAYRQHQPVSGFIFLILSSVMLLSILRLSPQLLGPSVLFDDRIVLRGFFRVKAMYRKDAAAVEIRDIANPRSGTKFSIVVLRALDGKELKITSTYGSVPEIYLTLQAWLAHR